MRKESSILGIDLHEHEIRVVEINTRSNKPSVGKIGRAPMPEGAITNGRVLATAPIAVALRLLLNSMGVGATARCIVGVLGDGTTLRTLSVPPVPDKELPTIIAGEVAHYQLVHSPGGAYSYLRLNPPVRSSGGESSGQAAADKRETWLDPEASDQNPAVVTVFAVEEDVITSLRETVEQANLTIEAIEPAQYGMYRTIMMAAGQGATLFALMVNPGNSDIAFVHKGIIVGYRRIDIGSRLLALQYTASSDGGQGSAFGYDDTGRSAIPASGGMNRLAVEGLSVEIQRTLNYYQREFPDAAVEDHIYLAIDDVRIEDLGRELSQILGVTIETVRPAVDAADSGGASGIGLGTIYASSFGMALQGQIMGRVPRMDLFSKQRAGVQQAETKRNFLGSIIASVLAILLGVVGYTLYHGQAVACEVQTAETTKRAAMIRQETDQTVQLRHTQEEQYKALRSEGLPVTEVFDFIASCVKTGTGLQSVTIAPDLTVTIQGQSLNEASMIDFNQSLQRSPVLMGVSIISFKQLQPEEGVGVNFEITGKTVSVGRIKLPEDIKKPADLTTPEAEKKK